MTLQDKINLINRAIKNSEINFLENEIYNTHGLTSPRTQNLLNLLSKDKKVLEIGTFCGACTSAIASSATNVITVDNWQDNEVVSVDKKYKKSINNPKKEFISNTNRFNNIKLFSNDIFSKEIFEKLIQLDFDIIFYDGPHESMELVKFIMLYESILKDNILVVDDYNFNSVKEGLNIGFQGLIQKPVKEYLIETDGESKETFWNGLGIFIFE